MCTPVYQSFDTWQVLVITRKKYHLTEINQTGVKISWSAWKRSLLGPIDLRILMFFLWGQFIPNKEPLPNLPLFQGKCKCCGKAFPSKLGFSGGKEVVGISCSWCKFSYHNKNACAKACENDNICDLGIHAKVNIIFYFSCILQRLSFVSGFSGWFFGLRDCRIW